LDAKYAEKRGLFKDGLKNWTFPRSSALIRIPFCGFAKYLKLRLEFIWFVHKKNLGKRVADEAALTFPVVKSTRVTYRKQV